MTRTVDLARTLLPGAEIGSPDPGAIYSGSRDIETGCAPERFEAEYKDGLDFLKSLRID